MFKLLLPTPQPEELGLYGLWSSSYSPQVLDIDLSKLRMKASECDQNGEATLCIQRVGLLPGMEGYGQAFVVSEEQKLYWCDMLFLAVQPPSLWKFRFWPKHPASFRVTMEKYSSELLTVELSLLRAMANDLRIDPDMFVIQFGGGIQGRRMNYYPPCPQANRVRGLTPHSDATGITLLLQTSDVDGLQIKKDGKWLPIKPVQGALIINIGDVLKIMSSGEYKSTEHRVMVNPRNERLSVAAFHSIKVEGTVGPLPDLAKKNHALYKTLSHRDLSSTCFQ